MIRFRNFRTPPYSPCEAQIVLHAICNLQHRNFSLKLNSFEPFSVSRAICTELHMHGVEKQATGDFMACQCLVQDLIDLLVAKNVLTIQDIERETQEVSKQYPPVFYPPMQ